MANAPKFSGDGMQIDGQVGWEFWNLPLLSRAL